MLEINQACAAGPGCFSGDTARFPVTISTSGSYRLTSNLSAPDEFTQGIVVSTSDVGVDLNDFAIPGPVTFSGTPVTCIPASGTDSGLGTSGATICGISVKNRSVKGMGAFDIAPGGEAVVTKFRCRWKRLDGINGDSGLNL